MHHQVAEGQTLHVLDVNWRRHEILAYPEGGRRVHGGPIDPTPFASIMPLAAVIDNFGGSAAEDKRNGYLEVRTGDTFVVEGIPGTWLLLPPKKYLGGDWCRLELQAN